MNSSTLKRGALLAAMVGAVVAPTAAAAACQDSFKFENDARLSVQALIKAGDWKQAPNETARSSTLYFMGFDPEDRPVKAGWAAMGVVVADGGMGSRAAGGVLWGKLGQDLYTGGDREQFASGREGVSLTLSHPAIVRACKRPYAFLLNEKNQLFANGALVGEIQD